MSQYGTEVRIHGGQTYPGCNTECGMEMASRQWEGPSKAVSEPGWPGESRLKLGMETWCPERLCYLGIGIINAYWNGLCQPNTEESLEMSFKGSHKMCLQHVLNSSSLHLYEDVKLNQ